MTEFERDILRSMNGEAVPGLAWGAAMGAAIEFLQGDGFVSFRGGNYEITEAGTPVLKRTLTSLIRISV